MRFAAILTVFACMAASSADEAPNAVPDAVRAALTQLRAAKPEEAIRILQDELAKDPGDAPAAGLLTHVLLVSERFGEADEVVNAAIAKTPNSADLHLARGDLVFREGQIYEAEKEYRQAYKINAKNAHALYGLARCLRSGAQRSTAAALVRAAYKLNPQNPEIGSAFQELQGDSPEKTAQLEAMLDSLGPVDTKQASGLKRAIAISKALNGRHSFELGSPYEHYQIPLRTLTNERRRAYGYGLTIQIGKEKSDLQLDTGAHGLVLSSKFAERAGIQRLADTEMGGIGNEAPRRGWIGFVDTLRIGNLELKNCIVDVSDRGSVTESGGLIGTDILKRFMVKLNFYGSKLELDPLPGPAWDGYTPVDRYSGPELQGFAQVLIIHHYLLMPTKVSEDVDSDQTPGFFLMDTGASFNSISTTVAPDLTKVRDSHSMQIKGLNGRVAKVYEADKLMLQFANFRQNNLGLTAIDMTNLSRSAGTEVMGTMGTPLLTIFRSITLDYRDGRVKFEFKP